MYRIQSIALFSALIGVFAVVGFQLFGTTGAILVLGLAFLVNWLGLDRARDLLLWMHRARALHRAEAPGLHAVVSELSRRAGIDTPQLAVYPAPVPNAFALAARRRQSVVAVSSGLLSLLSPREIRGVLAHEIAHLRHRDSALSLAAAILVQVITILSQGLAVLLVLAMLTGTVLSPVQILSLVLLLSGAPAVAALLQAGLMRTRERLADREAARLTGDPRGLASALHRLQQYTRLLGGWLRRFRFIYTAEHDAGASLLRTHPPTEERVRDLLMLGRRQEREVGRVSWVPAAAYLR